MTTEEIIRYLEGLLEEANELHDQARRKNPHEALIQIIRISTITHILDEIK